MKSSATNKPVDNRLRKSVIHRAKKSLGQNFLINQGILDKIVLAAETTSKDTVVEVGPGTGNLTKKLAEKAGRVITVEKDRRLLDELREKFKGTNVEIIEGDVLKLSRSNLEEKLQGSTLYKVVGNIPYYITSHFLRTVFEKWPRPEIIVLTVQKEVAQRIMAKPPHMNLLALSVQFYSNPMIIGYVSKGSFRPIPKVDSAMISLRPKSESLKPEQKDMFFKLIRAGFAGKRKKLLNNLAKNFGMIREDLISVLSKSGLKQDIRAENLSIEQWKELAEYIRK